MFLDETDSEFDGSFQEPRGIAAQAVSLSQPCRPKPDHPTKTGKTAGSQKPRKRMPAKTKEAASAVEKTVKKPVKSVARRVAVHDVSSSGSDEQFSVSGDSQEDRYNNFV